MWSSKLKPSHNSTSSSNLDPECVGWTGVAPSMLPHPIPKSEDGTLTLDLGKHTQVTHIASVPLQYTETHQTSDCNPSDNKEAVRVYVNQQGHTVKLARLAALPPSHHVRSKALKTGFRNQERNSKTQLPVENVQIKKTSNGTGPSVALQKLSTPLESSVSAAQNAESETKKGDKLGDGKKINELTTKAGKSDQKSVKTKLKALIKNHQNSDSNSAERLEHNVQETERENHPAELKNQLDVGLEKIMADLASLNLPTFDANDGNRQPNQSIEEEGKQEAVIDDCGKENDSPLKMSISDTIEAGNSGVCKDVHPKKPLSSRLLKGSSNFMLHVPVNIDSRKSSTSSLNSIHKTQYDVDSSQIKGCSSHEKHKSYDPERARAYIRQQKQERMNRLRAERERQQADMHARRLKLDELSRTSLKLVKASIKRKPSQGTSLPHEDGACESEKDIMNSTCVKEAISNSNELLDKIENDNKTKVNSSSRIFDQTFASNVPLPLDDSNAQLIKDISEMKCKIEAMAKSLKTTLEANRKYTSQSSTNGSNSASSGRISSHQFQSGLPDNSSQIPTESHLAVHSGLEKPVPSEQRDSHPLYLHSLTSNLRKMRESLQNVLSQNDGRSHSSLVVSKINNSGQQKQFRHRRISSTGSDSAFETFKYDWKNRTPSLDGHMSSGLEKKKITTSFPTLQVAGTFTSDSDRREHFRTSSETNIPDFDSNALGYHAVSHQAALTRTHSSDTNKSDEDLILGAKKESYPEWCKVLTSKPYPVNFISAVKRKLGGPTRSDPVHEDTHTSTGLPGCMTTLHEDSTRQSSLELKESLNLKSDLPLFVSCRSEKNSAPSLATLSPGNYSKSLALAHQSSILVPPTAKLQDSQITRVENSSSLKTSMLDALNLEKMQAEFVRALKPLADRCGDVTPAEKPLSAPSTPAKNSLKLRRPVFVEKAGKLDFDEKFVRPSSLGSADINSVESSGMDDPKPNDCVANHVLVPPNVNLASSRLERMPGSIDDWVSHSRGSQGNKSTSNGPNENSSSSATQEHSTSRETFEIGHVFNPTALHLQFQAELNILDSFNESLCQVMEVEKVCAIAQARHQALSELQSVAPLKKDKATDIQKSLPQSNSEISTVNYHRGSGNPSDITLLDTDSPDGGIREYKKSNNGQAFVPVRDGNQSPSSTSASNSFGSYVKEMIPDSTPALISLEERTSAPEGRSSRSADKSISEEFNAISDSVPEGTNPSRKDPPRANDFSKENTPQANDESSDGTLEVINTFNTMNSNGKNKQENKSMSVDLSLHSVKGDSTFRGDDLFIESLQSNDSNMGPTLVCGEDMFQFSLQMLEQLMHEEELRVQHKNTLLKLRVKVLGEMARAEVANLDLDKKKLREKGEAGLKDQITALRKKQRGIMLRFQQQREEIERVRRTEELAWQERRLMYLQQMHLVRMQISTRVMLHKFEKSGGNISKKSRIVVRSIQDSRNLKSAPKGLSSDLNKLPAEMSVGLTVTQSSSVSMISLASDGSKSSAMSNSSRRATGGIATGSNGVGAGDSESSHLEEQVLKGLNELESRCRNLKEREKVLHERRQSVEQIIQWKRKLDEEERRLRDVERQAHSRHRNTLAKHVLRDRSTSPFQFLENTASGSALSGNICTGSRNISDLTRSSRGNVNHASASASASGSASVTEDVDSSIPEELLEHSSKPSRESTIEGPNADHYANESFESELSEVKTLESQTTFQDGSQVISQKEQLMQQPPKIDSDSEARLPRMSERSNKYPGVTIKVPLSPRLQRVQRRRYSSGSDDSMVLSQTETGSEQSDIEGRISALSEQLHQCKAEAERLRREAKRTRNERLIAKEQSLQKQLQAYENYICQLRRNLETELKQSSVPIVRPQIKQPRVAAGKVASRRQDADLVSASGLDRSASHTTSPDASIASHRREEVDAEFKEAEAVSEAISAVVSEAQSEIASEVTSEVPSDVPSETSEVSENSSLLSQDAPSLVAVRSVKDYGQKQSNFTSNQNKKTIENFSNESESMHEILSVVKTEKISENSNSLPAESNDKKDCQEFWENQDKHSLFTEDQESLSEKCSVEFDLDNTGVNSGVRNEAISDCVVDVSYDSKDDGVSDNKDEASTDNRNDVTASIDQVKSITSEEEFDDASEALGDECEMVPESSIESNVIRVFVREKEVQGKVLSDAPSSFVSSVDLKKKREVLVDSITNEIFKRLLSECLRTATHTHPHTQDSLLDKFVNASLHEATADIISIYKRRGQVCRTPSRDVRKRVTEILAETQSSSKLRAEGRIKEMMTTTYGILTPDDSPCASPNLSSSPVQPISADSPTNEDADTTYNQMAETSARKSNAGKANDAPMGLMGENVTDNEGVSQEWFDEDFGLTRSRREAEELRQQQLKIEQEIEHLQQQQAQVHEQIPYYYVREIPNKPPPPYTPPGQAPRVLSSSTSLATSLDEMRAVSTDRSDILKSISSAVDLLYDARCRGLDVQCQEAPSSFFDEGLSPLQPPHLSEQELQVHINNARVYRIFLFDLAKELVQNAYSCENEDPSPPWLRPESCISRRKALAVVPKTKEMLHDVVCRQALVLFGFVPKASKENLTIRWSRKKRDHVDELLVRESQEEERQWTNYEQDEAVVKNNVAMAILDSLLDDTVQVLGDVFRRREQRQHCAVY